MQTTNVHYDQDTGVLELRLDDGAEFQITNAGHAKALKEKISVGGRISDTQREWLERYRITLQEANRSALKRRLASLRQELRQ